MKKLWQLCACAAGVLAGLWLTARILLPVGLPFLLGLGLARLARPLAARLRLPKERQRAHLLIVAQVGIERPGRPEQRVGQQLRRQIGRGGLDLRRAQGALLRGDLPPQGAFIQHIRAAPP